MESTYSGAPDECSIHWPQKLVNGCCPLKDCPYHESETSTK